MSNDKILFEELNLPTPILSAITELGFVEPTPIQQQSIPALLAGKDVLGEAQTGTGKTAAFGLPLLARLDANLNAPQMLVVCPTRELAIQVAEAITDFAKNIRGLNIATVYGGQSYTIQNRDLKRGPQIVVGTPGRMMDHIEKGRLNLDNLKACVLDEADEMLNMGFLDDIEWILDHVPEDTQMAFFSATMPAPIKKITSQFLTDPVHVKIAVEKQAKANITQRAWRVGAIGKTAGLERIAEVVDYDAMIVFVRTRNDTLTLAEHLVNKGFKAAALNGDMQQQDRERIVDQLKNGRIHILIATDVVARGLDVPRISHVINYDLPFDSESYVHRIGRTGRAGREGEAILFASHREMRLLNRLERATEGQITPFEMPDASQLSKHRIEKTKEKLLSVAASPNLEKYTEVLAKFTEESEITTEQLAAAMLYQLQQKLPLFPQADPVDKRGARDGRREGGRERGGRDGRREGGRERRNPGDFATYKFAVGRAQGVKPSDIVGAIANEVRINSREIGNIKLFDNHCHVELPKTLPSQGFEKLKNVTIRRHKINPSIVEGATGQYDSENRGKRPPRKRERSNDDRSIKTFKKKSRPRRDERSMPTFN
ncbi:MAG: DEAD/DEAH box helicase [Pseudoalteromonas spongiae]|uniref:ATP-dependent RNA helicase DeaD n=1 Tax=Pseudoalteromonas spongiae TaxID=298657 RepID=A0ABU8EYL7_9GAMM|nr:MULTISPECIES: DEAD/DEAH box helicase [Pseudoalteromonas]MEC8325861.1 DEAD/DEAH box helicase [Pseudomonadota bacterium]TMO84599.1 DEAD/DEAH family ATP-dependent RNA helicase [Pseudoalteromonas spongiae]